MVTHPWLLEDLVSSRLVELEQAARRRREMTDARLERRLTWPLGQMLIAIGQRLCEPRPPRPAEPWLLDPR